LENQKERENSANFVVDKRRALKQTMEKKNGKVCLRSLVRSRDQRRALENKAMTLLVRGQFNK
jgi:hypothetical protein